ncbi:hypothetical protein [Pasteurella testudinis]|nr:hypothetical protein [Pasteurella testudinis]
MNKLQFIKKTRPKLKSGDVFYYHIKNRFFLGVVLLTRLDTRISDNISITILLPNYSKEKKELLSIDEMKKKIIDLDLIAPPTNINKKAWTLGYFVNIDNITIDNILEYCRFYSLGDLYNYKYQETSSLPDFRLLGKMGTYAYEGIEYLIQLGLGLDYDEKEKPYKYYEDYLNHLNEQKLPYWYYNSIGKPKS